MKRKLSIALLCLVIMTFITGCGSSNSKSDSEYGYYTRDDGKRIWYKN